MSASLGRLVGYVSDTPSRTTIAAAVSVVCFGTIEFLVHVFLRSLNVSPLADAAMDALLVGLSFGLAVWVVLVGNRQRRERVRVDLERIAELNHEIRNALQVIAHSHFDADVEHRGMVMQSVNRIDDVLKRVVPVVGGTMPGGQSSPIKPRR